MQINGVVGIALCSKQQQYFNCKQTCTGTHTHNEGATRCLFSLSKRAYIYTVRTFTYIRVCWTRIWRRFLQESFNKMHKTSHKITEQQRNIWMKLAKKKHTQQPKKRHFSHTYAHWMLSFGFVLVVFAHSVARCNSENIRSTTKNRNLYCTSYWIRVCTI